MVLEASNSLLGVGLASVAAVGFAGQFLCVRLGTDDGDVTDAVLVVLCCNVLIVVPIAFVTHAPPYSALFTPLSAISFAAAGIAGMFVARLLMFTSIDALGASITSPVIASNVLFATVFAVVLLGERLTASHFLGIVLIVAGIAVVSWETAAATGPDRSLRETGTMLALPVAAAVCIGIEPIFVSTGLAEGTPILPGLAVMATVATVCFTGYLAWAGSLGRVPLRSASTAWYVAGGVSTTVAFLAYFAALTVAPVVVVMPLLQLTPLLVVVLSVLFLPRRLERVTWRVTAAATVVVLGTTLVSVVG
ncbi:DMT family transporter [Natrinema salsiterrestre]|uniref:DMT family transporter n=1 Tax=Natrinema salsiterrestre TaxID=2950540 RepID=A0A9Q4Q159_9EURY|nr:DMT family transporter [Natrinema salsiterrestre]MDF9746849.1 DMT family transporter [Natrinema salsiterrestre]